MTFRPRRVGDLIVTCTSSKSRNFQVGYALGEGLSLDEAVSRLGEVAEGVNTIKVLAQGRGTAGLYVTGRRPACHLVRGAYARSDHWRADAWRTQDRCGFHFNRRILSRGYVHEPIESGYGARIADSAGRLMLIFFSSGNWPSGAAGGRVLQLVMRLVKGERRLQPAGLRRQPEPVHCADRSFRHLQYRAQALAVVGLAHTTPSGCGTGHAGAAGCAE